MAKAIRTYATLELSQTAYDEIEKKLLEAGYEHLFARGPGSEIDMSGLTVTGPAKPMTFNEAHRQVLSEIASKLYEILPHIPIYCFMCDTMVKERCPRDNCLYAANERVRADLGLGQHPQ